ncbi:hypothetical protein K501DRAFT_205120 [Backusella circina FSU 941]|nr:hypothetical protein K501DRAFT_205120 [Backusella circina FSU 941]
MVTDPARRQRAYTFLVRQLKEFNQPVPLKHIVPILVTGWQDDGLWPKDMVVKGSD